VKAVLYSTGCPRCKVLKQKLDKEGVEYEVCEDIEKMKSMGIMSVPLLVVGDERYQFSDAIQKIQEIVHRVEEE